MFELQDRVTESVVGAIAPKLQIEEIRRANRKPTESLIAYDYYLRELAKQIRDHWTQIRRRSDFTARRSRSIPN